MSQINCELNEFNGQEDAGSTGLQDTCTVLMSHSYVLIMLQTLALPMASQSSGENPLHRAGGGG